MVAPHHLDVEILQALRRLVRLNVVTEGRAADAADDLLDAPLERIDTRELCRGLTRRRLMWVPGSAL